MPKHVKARAAQDERENELCPNERRAILRQPMGRFTLTFPYASRDTDTHTIQPLISGSNENCERGRTFHIPR